MLPGGIRVRGLSGGEKRRLSLCCATITNPDVLFADEPTSGMSLDIAWTIQQSFAPLSGCLEPAMPSYQGTKDKEMVL